MARSMGNVQKLADINKDAYQFYEEAQKKVDDATLEQTFKNLEGLHRGVVMNLRAHLQSQGIDPDIHGTAAGEAREIWTKLMNAVSNDTNETMIAQLEEAEDRCLDQVKNIIEDDDLPEKTKTFLENEFKTLKKSHDFMKDLKDLTTGSKSFIEND